MDQGAGPAQAAYEPGVPSIRALLPSIFFGAAIPLLVYNLIHHRVHSDATALIIAGVFPIAWITVDWVRTREIDAIGVVVLFGFAIGVITSTALGGNSYVLKARDSVFTAIAGLTCLVSLFTPGRPFMFFVGRYFDAGNDKERKAAYDELHNLPNGQRTFSILTLVWGVVLVIEAAARLILADSSVLPTGTFLAVSPIVSGVCIGGCFVFSIIYTKRARARAEAILAEAVTPPDEPTPNPSSIPLG